MENTKLIRYMAAPITGDLAVQREQAEEIIRTIDDLHKAAHALDCMRDPSTAFGILKGAVLDFISQQDGVATADNEGGTGLFGDWEMAAIAGEYARRRGKTFAP
jgi:hypothetical protein